MSFFLIFMIIILMFDRIGVKIIEWNYYLITYILNLNKKIDYKLPNSLLNCPCMY